MLRAMFRDVKGAQAALDRDELPPDSVGSVMPLYQ